MTGVRLRGIPTTLILARVEISDGESGRWLLAVALVARNLSTLGDPDDFLKQSQNECKMHFYIEPGPLAIPR